ncbi:MAG: histidine phosphatase family protein [Alphaproteobacteria bacterium]|nr:histidine phosphatase family protein [Alphaproteobacteria bacterium]
MESLILLRHAKAVRPHEAAHDRARDLTGRGRREAREAGEAIAALDLRPGVAIVSPAQRTRETWEIARAALPWTPRTIETDALYDASAETIWREAVEAAHDENASGVIVVGHNPGLHDLAALLVRQSDDRSRAAQSLVEHLPTSGFAAFALTGETLGGAGPRLRGWGRLADE